MLKVDSHLVSGEVDVGLPSLDLFRLSAVGRVRRYEEWMRWLGSFLLGHGGVGGGGEAAGLFDLIDEIWKKVTHTRPPPQLHMLSHAAESASGHSFLGLCSE
jgi:hypothetical protein